MNFYNTHIIYIIYKIISNIWCIAYWRGTEDIMYKSSVMYLFVFFLQFLYLIDSTVETA